MMPDTFKILVPSGLRTTIEDIERFYEHVAEAPLAGRYILDMRLVDFAQPYGALALLSAARYLAVRSGNQVQLTHLDDQVSLYLHRMDLFKVGEPWLEPRSDPDDPWTRNPRTANLLELSTIAGRQDLEAVIPRVERIFSRWLGGPHLDNLICVLSELCANIYDHSGDTYGCVLAQKYEAPVSGQIIIRLAVGDLGCGIRRSLSARHGQLGSDPLDYIQEALRGRSARPNRGGQGLQLVEQIAGIEDGHLWLRSETAAVFTQGPGKSQGRSSLAYMPGTQLAVEFRTSVARG